MKKLFAAIGNERKPNVCAKFGGIFLQFLLRTDSESLMLFQQLLWALIPAFALASACGIRPLVPIVFMALRLTQQPKASDDTGVLLAIGSIGLLIVHLGDLVPLQLDAIRKARVMLSQPLCALCGLYVVWSFLPELDPMIRFLTSCCVGSGAALLMERCVRYTMHRDTEDVHRGMELLRTMAAIVLSFCVIAFPILSALGIVVFMLVATLRSHDVIQRVY